jgi:hypothetical protein
VASAGTFAFWAMSPRVLPALFRRSLPASVALAARFPGARFDRGLEARRLDVPARRDRDDDEPRRLALERVPLLRFLVVAEPARAAVERARVAVELPLRDRLDPDRRADEFFVCCGIWGFPSSVLMLPTFGYPKRSTAKRSAVPSSDGCLEATSPAGGRGRLPSARNPFAPRCRLRAPLGRRPLWIANRAPSSALASAIIAGLQELAQLGRTAAV